jgi:hypothetical protein
MNTHSAFALRLRLRRAASCLCVFIIAILASGFVWGGKTRFVNASSGSVSIRYLSTAGPRSGDAIRGGGLADSTDNGDLVSVTVRYSDGHTRSLSASQVRKLKATVHDAHGVWWIEDAGITYLSGRAANIRQRNRFGRL